MKTTRNYLQIIGLIFLLIGSFVVANSQTPKPTAKPPVSPTPLKITDPLVRKFNEKVNKFSANLKECQRLFRAGTRETFPVAEKKCIEVTTASKQLLLELENEKLLKNISQTGLTQNDLRVFIKSYELFATNTLIALSNYLRKYQETLNYGTNALEKIENLFSDKELNSSQLFLSVRSTLVIQKISVLNTLASTLSIDLDKPKKALEYLILAIKVAEQFDKLDKQKLEAKKHLARIYFTLSGVYRKLNNQGKVIESLLKSLEIHQSLPVKNEEQISFIYFALGNAYHSSLNFKKALFYFEKELKRIEKTKNRESEANTLGSIALLYSDLNQEEKSKKFIQRQLEVLLSPEYDKSVKENRAKSIKDKELAKSLNENFSERDKSLKYISIANSYRFLKNYEKALEYKKKALEVSKIIKDSGFTQTVLALIGNMYLEQEDWENGKVYYEKALEISQTLSERKVYAGDLGNLGYAKFKSGNLSEALNNVEQSFTVLQTIGVNGKSADRSYTTALSLLAQIHNAKGNRRLAIFYGKQTVNAIQRQRQQLKNLDAQSQSGYLKKNEKPYRRLAGWLIAERRVAEAEEVLKMLKEEELSQYLQRDDKVARELLEKATLDGDERKALQKFDEIADEITKIGKQVGALREESKKYDPIEEFPKLAELEKLEAKLEASNTTFRLFMKNLGDKFFIKRKRERNNPVDIVSSTQAILNDIKQPKTVIVSTIIEEERLHLIVTTSKVNRAHTVEISEEKLNALVAEFRQALTNPNVDPRPLGKKLYDTLFPKDLKKDLAGVDADTIVWSLDGILRYVPMATLWDGDKYLVERYNQAVITLASRQNVKDTPTQRKNLTVFGVGVSKEANITGLNGSPKNFPALPAVPQELCSIVNDINKSDFCQQFKTVGVISGKNLSDEEFTFTNFKRYLGRYPIVHIASHFDLNPGNKGTSYLLLGGENNAERKLTLKALEDKIGNKLQGTEILTLSACNTGMSAGTKSSGKEIESFGAIAQSLGAKSVISSLWAVSDPSTKDLMTEFYKQLQSNPKIGKAEAMRKAQITLMQGNYKTNETPLWRGVETFRNKQKEQPPFNTDKKAPFAHPYFWSPFILIGNWK